ncbi:MAG: hypothetical protein R3194_07035 [Limnobacter sp.]|nr:hypothetical protein [Limnobacter sp.]
MNIKSKTLMAVVLSCGVSTAVAEESVLLMSYTLDSLKGKFGQAQETTVQSFTVGATLVGDRYRASAFIPIVSVDGPGSLAGGTVTSANARQPGRVNGLGDVVGTLSLDFVGSPNKKGTSIGLTGIAKLPTGDKQDGLGTGEGDFGLQLDLGYRFNKDLALDATVGRMNYGDSPQYPLLDGNYQSVGMTVGLTNEFTVNVNATKRQRIIRGGDERRESSITGIYSLSPKTALRVTGLVGDGDSSPDSLVSVGVVVQSD